MKGYFYLTFNEEDSIIIFGERFRNKVIIFKDKPGFFDAMKFSDPSPPMEIDFPLKFISVTSTSTETFHFHDPLLSQKFKFIIGHHSLKIIESDNDLSISAIFNVFNYFLIKKGSRMLFLTNLPNNKIKKGNKDKFLSENDEQQREKEG